MRWRRGLFIWASQMQVVAVLSALIHGASAVQLNPRCKTHGNGFCRSDRPPTRRHNCRSCRFARRPYVRRLWHRPASESAGGAPPSERSDRTSDHRRCPLRRSQDMQREQRPSQASETRTTSPEHGASIMDPAGLSFCRCFCARRRCSLASEERAPPGYRRTSSSRAGGPLARPLFAERPSLLRRVDF